MIRMIVVLMCFAVAVQAAELVENGGFEEWVDGAPVGWALVDGAVEDESGPQSVAAAVDDGNGGLALSLSGGTDTKRWLVVSQDIDVAGIGTVAVSGRMATRDVRADGHRYTNSQIMVIMKDAEGASVGRAFLCRFADTRDWTSATYDLSIDDGVAVVTVLCFLSMTGETLFDDISVATYEPIDDRAARWRADFERLVELLESSHPDPYASHDKAELVAELTAVADAADDLTDLQIAARATVAVARLGDAHTSIASRTRIGMPVGAGFAWFGDDVRVVWASEEYADLLGGRVMRCGESPIDDVMAAARSLVAAETEGWVRRTAPRLLSMPAMMHAMGLIENDDRYECSVVHDDGREVSVMLGASGEGAGRVHANPTSGAVNRVEYREDRSAIVAVYGACRDFEDYTRADMTREILDLLGAHDVTQFVLDVRGNGGGSSHQLVDVAKALADHPAEAWVLTDGGTFSSAVLDAAYFVLVAGAKVAGEPTGQRPDHFGQMVRFDLPRTGLGFNCSSKRFGIMPDNPGWVPVDLPVVETWEDFVSGRDAVLEAVLAQQ